MSIRYWVNSGLLVSAIIASGSCAVAQDGLLTSEIPPAQASSNQSPGFISHPETKTARQSGTSTSSQPALPLSETSGHWVESKVSSKPQPSSPPFRIGSTLSRTAQRVTGITFVSDCIASRGASHVLSQKLGGKVSVKVKSYSLTDLLAGKIKSLSLKSEGSIYKNITLGEVDVASSNPIWYQYRRKSNQKRGLQTPIVLNVKAELNSKDVAAALESDKVAQSLHGLKLDLPGLGDQQLQILQPKVTLAENSIKIDAILITVGGAPETGVPIVISGSPYLRGEKVMLANMKVESPYIVEPDKFAAFAQDLLNPIFDFGRLDRKDHAFRLKEIAVKNDVVEGQGQLLIVPKSSAP